MFRPVTSSPYHSVVDRTKKGIRQLITKGWQLVFQWASSDCGILSNDIVEGLAKDVSNWSSPEEPTTYQQAVADITIKSALLVLDVTNNKCKTKLGRQYWRINSHLFYLEVCSLSIFFSSLEMIAYSDTWTGLDYGTSPLCLLCGDSEESGLDHFQRCQSLGDDMDDVKNRGRQLKL